jgi:hypothetical protein
MNKIVIAKRLCACGCGKLVTSRDRSTRSKKVRFCFGHKKTWRSEHRGIKRSCECGCGIIVSGFTNSLNGPHVKRFVVGHNSTTRKGEKNPLWKGGRTNYKGYILIRAEDHPRASLHGKYVHEHILVMENYLGRYLQEDREIVHPSYQS